MTQRRSSANSRRRKRRRQVIIRRIILIAAIVIVVGLAVFIVTRALSAKNNPKPQQQAGTGETQTETTTVNPKTGYAPGPPSPAFEGSATIGATGDILLHDSVLNGAYNGDGEYDFSESFKDVAPYWSALDYMIVNLEVPCGGDDDPTGYPVFDAPDSIVTDLKEAGVDMCLTATNHTYDCGSMGFSHTQEVLRAEGMDYTGTRMDENESYVVVKDINGIRFGFVCYTYDTRQDPSDWKSLNGIEMNDSDVNLINSFCYSDLDSFYSSVRDNLREMDSKDCDVTVVFVHWGDEYMDYPNGYQEEMAQEMCNMGVDVIIGGHPHVIQEFDVLTSDSGNTTYCLYSMGNAISSQRKEIMVPEEPRGYTEDGLVMEFTFSKLNNGKVKLTDVYVLPTWVEIGGGVYYIDPLDSMTDSSSWPVGSMWEAIESYNRTLERIGEAYPALREELKQPAVPAQVE